MAEKVSKARRPGPGVVALLWRALLLTWRSFSEETSVHGVKYVRSGRLLDRCVWAAMVVGCGVMAGVLVAMLSFRYLENPTRTVYLTQHEPVSLMHFPAVTVCAPRKITAHYRNTLMGKLKVAEEKAQRVFDGLPQLLGFIYSTTAVDNDTLGLLDTVLTNNEMDTEKAMLDLAPPCGDVLARCRWKGRDVSCTALFKRSKTYVGYCCSFNYNSNVKGVAYEDIEQEYVGPEMGLSFVVDTHIDEFSSQVFHKMDSFKILLHGSSTYAGRFADELVLPQRKEVFLACAVQSIILGDQAAKLDVEARKCVLPQEQSLRYFQAYMKDNCLLECEMSACLATCGCLPFNYPRLPGEPLCAASAVPCVSAHLKAVLKDDWSSRCSCSRQCNQNVTTIEVHSAQMKTQDFNIDSFYSSSNPNETLVHVFYSRQVGTVVKRVIHTYWVDLISSFGGMFNLFLGCSFISILELFYFLLVKLPHNYVALSLGERRARGRGRGQPHKIAPAN